MPTAAALHDDIQVNIVDREPPSTLFNIVFFRSMHDRHVFAQQADAPASRDYRYVADRAGLKIAQHVSLAVGRARLVVLNVVVGEDAREFSNVGEDKSAIAVFEELQDFGFVIGQGNSSLLYTFVALPRALAEYRLAYPALGKCVRVFPEAGRGGRLRSAEAD